MNLYCIKCSKFTKNNNIKIKNYFKKMENIDKEELTNLLKV